MQFPLIDLLYQALNTPYGVAVRTSNPERLRQKLYAERKKDDDLACLSLNISPTEPDSVLWIIKKPEA
jgi:hypothetical protein